ncbi:MAG: aminoacyl-tRNA hydrolase [Acidimicrobiaceae bacterium]|nr:aminoacyl-tRNA hydrolase [Acidimicrobiaceae bacterium]
MGADAVEALAARTQVTLRADRRSSARLGEAHPAGRLLLLAVPQTYMNESGLAAQALVRRAGISEELERLVVVHDELDLPVGTVRIKRGGGTAGHNGLRSLQAHLHSLDFLRVRIGIGKPPGRMAGADYVLRRPGKAEREALDVAVQQAADAIEAILAGGADAAMNELNGR